MSSIYLRFCTAIVLLVSIVTIPPSHVSASSNITGLSLELNWGCVIISGGVWCWGLNMSGQLGNGTKTDSKKLVRVIKFNNKPLTNVTDISISGGSVCAVAQRQVWCWGSDIIDWKNISTKAKRILDYTGKPLGSVTQVSVGQGVACALRNGQVWCWGNNSVGVGSTSPSVPRPRPVKLHVSTILTGATKIYSNGGLTCAIARKKVYCWGWLNDRAYGDLATHMLTDLKNVTDISIGQNHACALDSGKVYCFGSREYGQTGYNYGQSNEVYTSTNQPLTRVTRLSDMGGYSDTSCAISKGKLWCWGNNSYGQLSDGTLGHRSRAVLARRKNGVPFGSITAASSGSSTCIISNRQLWCIGSINYQVHNVDKMNYYRIPVN